MTNGSFADAVTLVIALAALGRILAYRLGSRARPEPKLSATILIGMFTLMVIWQLNNTLEWLGISFGFDRYEDFVELLIPFFWGALVYVRVQQTLTQRLQQERQLAESLVVQQVQSQAEANQFLQRLQELVRVGHDLAMMTSTDELCRETVELGRSRLGFDRMGIWLIGDDSDSLTGTYGVDELGHLRDERGLTMQLDESLRLPLQEQKPGPWLFHDTRLRDDRGGVVGSGSSIQTPVWDGMRNVGWISCDNLLSQAPLNARDGEILTLYAATFGHLYARLQGQQRLEQSEKLYRTIFETTGTGMAILDAAGVVSLMNVEMAHITGYAPSEAVGKLRYLDVVPAEDVEQMLNQFSEWQEAERGTPSTMAARIQTRSGDIRYVIAAGATIPDTRQSVISIVDVTDRRSADARYRQRALQQTALNAIIAEASAQPDLSALISTALDLTLEALNLQTGFICLAGHAARRGLTDALAAVFRDSRLWPKGADDPVVISDAAAPPPGTPAQLDSLSSALTEAARTSLLGVRIALPNDHSSHLVLMDAQTREWTEDEVALVSAIGRQLGAAAERLSLLEQVQAQAQTLKTIIDTLPEGVALLDSHRNLLSANPSGYELLSQLAPTAPGEPIAQLGDSAIESLLAHSPTTWNELRVNERIFEAAASLAVGPGREDSWVLVLRDVTRARTTEEHRQRQDRLAAVGQLAAGIAHDFNNLLSVIVLYTQMAIRDLEASPLARQRLATVIEQAHQATALIRQVLDFSRKSPVERQPLNLIPFLSEAIKILERTLPDHVRVDFQYEPGEYWLNADPSQLQQALLNLALNARDAMMPKGGTLTITVGTLEVLSDALPAPDMASGNWIALRVADTGTGISPEHHGHLFEPFFTTKAVGSGTGLGLAQVHGIVMQHDGAITVTSTPGEGTVFTLYLPPLATAALLPKQPVTAAAQLATGSGDTILLVEDNEATQAALSSALKALNYRVITAQNGREALDALRADREKFSLVLSDAVMPEMGGVALLQAMRRESIVLPVIICSGHLDPEVRTQLAGTGQLTAWLTKPVALEDLATALADALQRT